MSADESAAPWGEREPQYLESTSGWQQVTDPVSGSIYWWDPRTDETSWQAPQEVLDAEAGAESQQWDSADKGDEAEDDWAGSRFGDWAEAIDEASGETYYYNIVTNETAWECPAAGDGDEPRRTEDLGLDVDRGYGGDGGDDEGYAHEMRELSRLTTLTGSSLHLHGGRESTGSSSADAAQASRPTKDANLGQAVHAAVTDAHATADATLRGRPPAAALCSGWLYKRDVQRGRNWRRRYFCLSGVTLSYYASDKMCAEARGPGRNAKGQFLLVPGTVVVAGAPPGQIGHPPSDAGAGSNRLMPPSLPPPPPRPVTKPSTSLSRQTHSSQPKRQQPVARTLNQSDAFKRRQRGHGRSPPLPPPGPAGGSAHLETGGHAAEQARSRTGSLSGLASKATKALGSALRGRSGKALSGARLAEGSDAAGAAEGLPGHARFIFSIVSPAFDPSQHDARARGWGGLHRRVASAANASLVLAVSSMEERDAWIDAVRTAVAHFGLPGDWAGAVDRDDMYLATSDKDNVALTSDSASVSAGDICDGDSSYRSVAHSESAAIPRVHGWLKASRGRVALVDGRRLQRPVFSGGRKAKARKGDDSSSQLWTSAYYQLHATTMLCYCDERRDVPAPGAPGVTKIAAPEYDGDAAASAAGAGAEGGAVGDVPLFAQLTAGEIAPSGGLMLPRVVAAAAKASRRNTISALVGDEGAHISAAAAVLPADASSAAPPPSRRTLATGAPALLRCVVEIVDAVEVGGSIDNNVFAVRHTGVATAASATELPLTYFLAPTALEKERWLRALHSVTSAVTRASAGAEPPEMVLATEQQMLWASTAGVQPGSAEEHLAAWFAPPDDFVAMSVPTAAVSAAASDIESARDAACGDVGGGISGDGDGAEAQDVNLDVVLGATIRRPASSVNFAATTGRTGASTALAGQEAIDGVGDMETPLQSAACSAEWGIVKSVAAHARAAECGVRRGDALHAVVPAKVSDDDDESMGKGIPLVLAAFDTAMDCARFALRKVATISGTDDGIAPQLSDPSVKFVFRQPQRLAGWLWKRPRGYARQNKGKLAARVTGKGQWRRRFFVIGEGELRIYNNLAVAFSRATDDDITQGSEMRRSSSTHSHGLGQDWGFDMGYERERPSRAQERISLSGGSVQLLPLPRCRAYGAVSSSTSKSEQAEVEETTTSRPYCFELRAKTTMGHNGPGACHLILQAQSEDEALRWVAVLANCISIASGGGHITRAIATGDIRVHTALSSVQPKRDSESTGVLSRLCACLAPLRLALGSTAWLRHAAEQDAATAHAKLKSGHGIDISKGLLNSERAATDCLRRMWEADGETLQLSLRASTRGGSWLRAQRACAALRRRQRDEALSKVAIAAKESETVHDIDDAQNNEPLSRRERRLLRQCITQAGGEAEEGVVVEEVEIDDEMQSVPVAGQEDDEEEEEEVRWGGTAGFALAARVVASESASAAMRVMAGHLVKRAVRTGKDWKRRFFVLTDDRLVYYKGETEAREALGLNVGPGATAAVQGLQGGEDEQPLPPYPCIAHTTEKMLDPTLSSTQPTTKPQLLARSLSSGRILPPKLPGDDGTSVGGSHFGSSVVDREMGVSGFAAATGTLFLLPHSRVMSFNEWRRRLVRPTVLFSPAAATARGAMRTFDDNERVIARRSLPKVNASDESIASLPPPPLPPSLPPPPSLVPFMPPSNPPPRTMSLQHSEDGSEPRVERGPQVASSGLEPEECPAMIAPFHFVVVTERAAIHLAAQNTAEQKAWMAAIRIRIARMDTGVGRPQTQSRESEVANDEQDHEAQSLSARGFLQTSTGAVARMHRHNTSDTASESASVGKDETGGEDDIAYVQRIVLTGRQANWHKTYFVVMPTALMAFVQGGASSEEGVTNGVNAGIKGAAAAWSATSRCGDSNIADAEHDVSSSPPSEEYGAFDNSAGRRHTRAASTTDSLTFSEAAFGHDETRARALSVSSRQRLARTKMRDVLCLTTRAVKRDVALTARTVLREHEDVGGNVDNAIFALSEDGGVRWQWFRAPDRPAKALWLISIKAALAGARLLRPVRAPLHDSMSRLCTHGLGTFVVQGSLFKLQSGPRHSWNRRFFVLSQGSSFADAPKAITDTDRFTPPLVAASAAGPRLEYFHHEHSTSPRGTVFLSSECCVVQHHTSADAGDDQKLSHPATGGTSTASTIEDNTDDPNFRHGFLFTLVTPGRAFTLGAPSRAHRSHWMEAIRRAITHAACDDADQETKIAAPLAADTLAKSDVSGELASFEQDQQDDEDEDVVEDADIHISTSSSKQLESSGRVQLNAARTPSFYSVQFESAPLGLSFGRRRQCLVVTAVDMHNDATAQVVLGSSIEAVNGVTASTSPYDETTARLIAWAEQGRGSPLTITFRAPAYQIGDLVKDSRGAGITGRVNRALKRSHTRRFILRCGKLQYFKLKQRKKKWGAGKPRDVVDGEDDKDSDYELIFKGEFSLRHAAVSIFSRDFADLDPQAATGTQQHDEDFALTVHAPNQSLVIHAPSHDTLLRWATAIREAISTENGGTFHLAHSIRMLRYSMRSKQRAVLRAALALQGGDLPDGMLPNDPEILRRKDMARSELRQAKIVLSESERILQFWRAESDLEMRLETATASSGGRTPTGVQEAVVAGRQRAQTLAKSLNVYNKTATAGSRAQAGSTRSRSGSTRSRSGSTRSRGRGAKQRPTGLPPPRLPPPTAPSPNPPVISIVEVCGSQKLGFSLSGGQPSKVHVLVPGGAADAAGARVGSELTHINDLDVQNHTCHECFDMLKALPRPVRLTFRTSASFLS